jgi:hypothetical protein
MAAPPALPALQALAALAAPAAPAALAAPQAAWRQRGGIQPPHLEVQVRVAPGGAVVQDHGHKVPAAQLLHHVQRRAEQVQQLQRDARAVPLAEVANKARRRCAGHMRHAGAAAAPSATS